MMKCENVEVLPISSSNSNWKLATLLLATLATMATFAKTFDWRITGNDTQAAQFAAYHGETVRFNLIFSGAASNCTAAAARIYYQTNGMDQAWWPTDGLTFAPTNDVGAAAYRFFVRAQDDLGVNYTANGILRMLPSPGFVPNQLPLPANVITQTQYMVQREYTRNVAVTNVQLMAGQIFAGLALIETNLVAVVPVIGTTACVRVWAPYAEGYYTPNQFSAIEIGDGNQVLFSQRIIAGQALYCPNPSMLRFTDGLDPADQEDTCTSLQDYLDVLSPDTIASLTAGLVPTTGDSVIDGSLTVNGQLISDGTIVITNADIIAKGFSVINRNLTADGMTISNGMCHIRCALLDLGLGTPRIHLENGTGASDYDGTALTNITFGGTWPAPTTNLRDYMHGLIEHRITNALYSYEERIREIVREELGK